MIFSRTARLWRQLCIHSYGSVTNVFDVFNALMTFFCCSVACRHSVYKSQYRAMFVTHCRVDKSQTLRYPSGDAPAALSKRARKKLLKRNRRKDVAANSTSDSVTSSSSSVAQSDSAAIFNSNSIEMNSHQSTLAPAQRTSLLAGASMDQQNSGAVAAVGDNQDSNDELYNPVTCTECNTTVGVIDQSEIVHFFNVLASY